MANYNAHSKSLYEYANSVGIKTLNIEELKKYKKSETLFVLGSGWSINEISDSQWEIIKKKDSIGFNLWVIHDFQPTYYMLEGPRNSEMRELLCRKLNEKKEAFNKTPILIKDAESKRTKKVLSKLSISYFDEIQLCKERFIPGNDIKTLSRYFNKLEHHFNANNYLLKKQASVFSILSLGYLLDYDKVILCGIDLNGSEYFYNSEKYLDENVVLKTIIESSKKAYQNSSFHKTADPNLHNLPIDELVSWFNEVYKEKESEILVENKSSLLSKSLNIYKYE